MYTERSASLTWRIVEKIARATRWAAPRGSLRRRGLRLIVHGVLAVSRSRPHWRLADRRAPNAGRSAFRLKPLAAPLRDGPGQTPGYPANATTLTGRVLVIDHAIPTPDRDSGSLRMMEILKAIRRRGHHVTFIPEDMLLLSPYAQDLQNLGVELIHQPHYQSVTDYLERHGRAFDLAIISRAPIAARHLDRVKSLASQAKVVFDTVDLYFVRESRAAQLLKDDELRRAAGLRKKEELDLARKADATLVVSPIERESSIRSARGSTSGSSRTSWRSPTTHLRLMRIAAIWFSSGGSRMPRTWTRWSPSWRRSCL